MDFFDIKLLQGGGNDSLPLTDNGSIKPVSSYWKRYHSVIVYVFSNSAECRERTAQQKLLVGKL